MFISLAITSALVSCRDLSFSPYKRGDAIARVGSNELYIEDVSSLFTSGMNPADSLSLLNSYIDGWLKAQLKVEVAESLFHGKAGDIEKLVADYRSRLFIYKYENEYLNANVDTMVSRREISDYYMLNRADFVIASAMLKAVQVRIPVGFRQESQMRLAGVSGKADKLQDIIDMAEKNGLQYKQFTEWTDFSEVVSYMPRLPKQQYDRIKSKTGFYEATEGEYRYFLIVTEILPEGGIIPQEMTENTIRTIILNKRRNDAIRRLEDSLYDAAAERGGLTVNVPQ